MSASPTDPTDAEMEVITEHLGRAIADGHEADVRAALEAAGDRAEDAADSMLFVCLQLACEPTHTRGAVRVLKLVGARATLEAAHRTAREAVALGDRALLAMILSQWDVHPTSLTTSAKDSAMLLHLHHLGADVTAVVDWKTPLHCAAGDGAVDRVALLLSLGAHVDAKDSSKASPLHHAVWRGHRAAVRMLLDAGANPNRSNSRGFSPLHGVTDVEIARALIAAGADVEKLDRRMGLMSPLATALSHANEDVAAFLLQCGAVWTPMATTFLTTNEHKFSGSIAAPSHLQHRIAQTSHRACALVSTLQQAHRAATVTRAVRNHLRWTNARTSKVGPMSTADSDFDTDSADEHTPDEW